MFRLLLVSALSALVILSSGCGKKDDPSPTPKNNNNNNNNNHDNPPAAESYYFNFNFNNQEYTIKDGTSDYNVISGNELGVFYGPNYPVLYPEIHINFTFDHDPSDSDILNMAGVAYYFGGSDDIIPELTITDASGDYNSIDSLDQNNYIKINSIKFVKKDTSVFGESVNVYLINGICSALLDSDQSDDTVILKDGSFNLLIARMKD